MQLSELFVLAVLLSWGIAFVARYGRRQPGLPPGPATVPLLGNAHMLGDGKDMYLKVTAWARHYGDIYSLKIGSGTMVVLSSATAIKQVVDKHGWAGSSRPENYIAEVCGSGGEFNILFADDSPRIKNLRRTIARFFSPQNSLKYVPVQAAESTLLLHDLMTRPEEFTDSIRRFTHSLAKSLDKLIHALAPGAYPPFDLLPALKYLPAAFAPWRAVGNQVEYARTAIHTQLYKNLQRRQAEGDEESTECFVGKLLQSSVPAGDEQLYSYSGLSLLDAGSDTTGAFLLSFVLLLATYPECQARAWKEINAVVGGERLPVPADFPKLPYLDALIKECLRFRPQLPMGVPHLMAADVVYKDYLIPKGAVVILNTFALFHDPEIFENPEVFNPDRFVNSEHGTRPGMDTDFRDNFLFGGGRRICPGQWIARSTMQLAAMRMIWALKFDAATSPRTSAPVSQDLSFYASDFVVMPRPFECKIEPRSVAHCEAVNQALPDAKLYLDRYGSN